MVKLLFGYGLASLVVAWFLTGIFDRVFKVFIPWQLLGNILSPFIFIGTSVLLFVGAVRREISKGTRRLRRQARALRKEDTTTKNT